MLAGWFWHLLSCSCFCMLLNTAAGQTVFLTGARRVLSHSLPPSPSGLDPYRAAIMGSSPLRQLQQHSRIPAGLGSHRGRMSPPQTGPLGASLAGFSGVGSPPGSVSPPLGPLPSHGASPRVSPSPRVVREQWGLAGETSSPRIGCRAMRGGGHMAPSFVSQSLDGSLMQAGAAREQHGQMGALQQVGHVWRDVMLHAGPLACMCWLDMHPGYMCAIGTLQAFSHS
jgi:hypothetical protein